MLHGNIKSEQCRRGISDHARLALHLFNLAVDRTIEDISALTDPNFHLRKSLGKSLSGVGRDIVKEAAAPIERMATIRALDWAHREIGFSKIYGHSDATVDHNNAVAECQARIFKGIQRARKNLPLNESAVDPALQAGLKQGQKLNKAMIKALETKKAIEMANPRKNRKWVTP